MNASITRKEWDSKSALLHYLAGANGRTVVLGTEAESPRKFYSFTILFDDEVREVGVLSSGLGTDPDVTVVAEETRAIVGHDTWVTCLDLHGMSVLASQRLEGVFYEFLDADIGNDALVLHELGAIRVAADGSVSWSMQTDVVEQASLDGEGNLVIKVMDDPRRVVVEMKSGTVLNAT